MRLMKNAQEELDSKQVIVNGCSWLDDSRLVGILVGEEEDVFFFDAGDGLDEWE